MVRITQAAGFRQVLQRNFMGLHLEVFTMQEPVPQPAPDYNEGNDTGREHRPEPEVGIGTGLPVNRDGVTVKENR